MTNGVNLIAEWYAFLAEHTMSSETGLTSDNFSLLLFTEWAQHHSCQVFDTENFTMPPVVGLLLPDGYAIVYWLDPGPPVRALQWPYCGEVFSGDTVHAWIQAHHCPPHRSETCLLPASLSMARDVVVSESSRALLHDWEATLRVHHQQHAQADTDRWPWRAWPGHDFYRDPSPIPVALITDWAVAHQCSVVRTEQRVILVLAPDYSLVYSVDPMFPDQVFP